MAGQSEAEDDLIAELAKLMAQDAQVDRTSKPSMSSTASAQFTPIRIPGGREGGPVSDAPRDFLRALSAGRTAEANQDSVPAAPSEQAAGKQADADPFQFDFGIGAAPRPAMAIEDAPEAVTDRAAGASGFQSAPVATPAAQEHDSIADLISADMADNPAPADDEPAPAVPNSVRAEPLAPAPVLMNTVVAATPVPQPGMGLGGARPDQDRFKVPPVFGLGSATSPAAAPSASAPAANPPKAIEPSLPPAVEAVPARDGADAPAPDPIDEIENLIGRAMRVEFDLPEEERAPSAPVAPEPRPAPSPALRSLATPTRREPEVSEFSAADQAIFAAAQATGAKVGWAQQPSAAESEPEPFQAAPRQRRALGMSRALAGPLVAITLLLAAGFGLYWVLGLGGRDTGPAPLLTADTAPIKQAAPPGTTGADTSAQSVVFNEMDGTAPAADEQLVSRDQTDVNEVTQVAAAASDQSDEGLANRKVRTVKVRPDGTIVSGEESVAGSAILPVDRPNVPAVPGAETAEPELLANIDPVEPEAVQPEPAQAEAAAPAPAATLVPVEPGSTVQAVDLSGNAITGKSAIIPRQRPTGLRLSSAAPTTTETPAASVAETAPAPSVPGATEVEALGNTAPAYVQLASQRSEADARQSAQNMVTRYGPLFGGANLEVQRVDLGAKGIYYRVRVPASSLEEANMICTNVKAAGGDCFTL